MLAGFIFLIVFAEDIIRIMEFADKEDGEIALSMYFTDKYGDNQFPQIFLAFFTILFIPHMIIASIIFRLFGKK